MLDVVFFGEFVAVGGADELLEFVEGLLAEVVSIDQEEDAFGAGVFDEPVAEVDGGEGFTAAGGHLDQGAGAIFSEGFFEVENAFNLDAPEVGFVQGGQLLKAGAELGVEPGQADEFIGAVEGENRAAAGVFLERVCKVSDFAGGFVGERQGQAMVREGGRKAVQIFAGLGFHAGERVAFGLGFNDGDGFGVGVEHVVRKACGERKFADGHALPGRDVHVPVVLNQPAGLMELTVDLLPGFFFRRHGQVSNERSVLK